MKTITILLSFVANEHNIVHTVDYETSTNNCYQAEQLALTKAYKDFVDTGKAHTVSIDSCISQSEIVDVFEDDTDLLVAQD